MTSPGWSYTEIAPCDGCERGFKYIHESDTGGVVPLDEDAFPEPWRCPGCNTDHDLCRACRDQWTLCPDCEEENDDE